MLVLGEIVSNSTRQNMLRDMIAGGDRRARWAHKAGEKALEVIESQRNLAHMVMCHRETLKRHASILLRPSDLAEASPATLRSDQATAPAHAITRRSTFARLAAAEVRTQPKTKSRRKQFRQVQSLPLTRSLNSLSGTTVGSHPCLFQNAILCGLGTDAARLC